MMNNSGTEQTVQAPIHSGFRRRSTARRVLKGLSLMGKIAVVTGGYSGDGLEAVRALAEAGATVVVPARQPEKARAAVAGIPRVEVESMDLMDPASIDGFAERFLSTGRPLHMLINSAGIMASPLLRDNRGYEAQFATNHLGHFQLTAALWPALVKAEGARVVAVSSRAHRLGGVRFQDPNFAASEYDKWKAYAQSKTANVLFALELDKRAKAYGVRAFSVHPGLIPSTGIGRFSLEGKSPFVKKLSIAGVSVADKLKLLYLPNLTKKAEADKFKTMKQGAATSVWCATSEMLNGMGGVYCEDCDIAEAVPADSIKGSGVRPWAIDADFARGLWQLSEKLAGIKFPI